MQIKVVSKYENGLIFNWNYWNIIFFSKNKFKLKPSIYKIIYF